MKFAVLRGRRLSIVVMMWVAAIVACLTVPVPVGDATYGQPRHVVGNLREESPANRSASATVAATGWQPAVSHSSARSSISRSLMSTAAPRLAGTSPAPNARSALVPLSFQPNRGQAGADVRFLSRTSGYDVYLHDRKLQFHLFSAMESPASRAKQPQFHPSAIRETEFCLQLLGASDHPQLTAFGELPGKANYLPSSDASTWIAGVPTYAGVLYREVYRGVDVVFHGAGSRLEYDFTVAPGADAAQIAWQLDTTAVRLADSGDLVVESGGAELRMMKPVIYQPEPNGRRYVAGVYQLRPTETGAIVSFDLGEYDHTRPLIIDPVISYSTRTSGVYGSIGAMTVDNAGNAYLLTTSNALQVTKLSADGSTALYTTSIGSGYSAGVTGAAVDNAGRLYMTGFAGPSFPTTATAYQPVSGSGTHAFLTVLDPAGATLVYSTYLQGNSTDYGVSLALDSSGASSKPVIAGFTYSSDFPNTGGVSPSGSPVAFVAKFDPTLSGTASLVYSTLIPGTNSSWSQGVAADAAGNVYALVQGDTISPTPGAFSYDGIYVLYGGVYVAKLNASGGVAYIAYLGYANAGDIAADRGGNAYVVGDPLYGDFPSTSGAYQTSFPFGFLSVLNPSGSALVYSTFLGGPSGGVTATSVAVPSSCVTACPAYVAGFTSANDFPITSNAIQKTLAGSSDAFVTEVSGDGSAALFSTYLGGANDENISQYYYVYQRLPRIALDGGAPPNIYVGGNTSSSNYPVTLPGGNNGFLTKISPANAGIVIPDTYSVNFPGQTLNVASAPISVNLRNYGSATVSIGSLATSAGFSQVNSCGGSIAGGSSCNLQLKFTPTYVGQVTGKLTINHDGTNTPTTITLTGTGIDQGLINISPLTLHFGTQAVNTASASQAVNVTNQGTKPATIFSISISGNEPEFTQTNNCPGVLLPGASCTAALTFSPLTVGYFSTYLVVQTNSAVTSTYFVGLDGTGSGGTGVGPSALTYSTTAITFPDQPVGIATNDEFISVYNTGTVPVTFGAPSIAGAQAADFTVPYNTCPQYAVIPGGVCTLGFVFTPSATGTRNATVTLPNSTGTPGTISLTGNGVTPDQSLSYFPTNIVFPDQPVGTSSGQQMILVTNQGNAPVTIDRVYDSGNDFRITSTSCVTVLSPRGSTCYIEVAFTPTATGAITGSVTLVDSAADSPKIIPLSGNGVISVKTLLASPSPLGFEDTVVGATTYSYLYLTNPGNTDVAITKLTNSLADFSASGCSTVPAGSECTIAVYFTPQTAGARSDTLSITNSATPGTPLQVPLAGSGITPVGSVEITPLTLGFPDTVVGTTSGQQAITIYNPGTANVSVTTPPSASAGFAVVNSCSTIFAGSSCTIYITFKPTQAGAIVGTFSIGDTATGSPHTATLVGNGINPLLEVIPTPSSLGFEDQVVGTTSTYQPIYFFNPGNTNVGISKIAVQGEFAIYSDGCGTRVPAESYCVEYITFSPTASGLRTGTLALTDTASNTFGVSLYGNGLTATTSLTVTPPAMDFGAVKSGTTSAGQTLYLTNSGTQPLVVNSVTPSAGFHASGCTGTINPGAQCGLSVTYTASGSTVQNGTVTVTNTATAPNPISVSLTGTPTANTPAVSVSPNGLSFAQTVVGKTTTLNVSFLNNSGAAVTVTSVTPSPAPSEFAIRTNNCATVNNGSSCSVSVNFTPTAAGVRQATLTFNSSGGNVAINLAGYAQAAITELVLSAAALTFPDQPVGSTSSTQLVYLWNEGTVAVTVNGNASTTPGDFAISSSSCTNGANIPAGSYCYAYVQFHPGTATTVTGGLSISINNDAASPHVVALTGKGVAATKNLAFSATNLQFADQPTGITSPIQYVVLYNSGNANVALGSVTVNPAGGDFAIGYNGCGATLVARSNCTLGFTFNPAQPGLSTASVDIADDAVGNPHSILLTGNAIAATRNLTLTGNSFVFPDTPVGTKSTYQTLTVYNTGTAPVTFTGITNQGDANFETFSGCRNGQVVPPRSSCTAYPVFTPTQTGARSGKLTINTSGGNYDVNVSGKGVAVVHDSRVSATAVAFPDQAVGNPTSIYTLPTVTLFNTGNVPLTISSITVSTPGQPASDFSNPYSYTCPSAPSTLAVGSSCTIYLTFAPTATGLRTGVLTITDDSAAQTHTVSLSGNGVNPSPSITVSPGNLQFLPQAVGSTNYLYVTVTNAGNFPITFSGVNVTNSNGGSDFALYSNGCSTLQTYNYQCTIYVSFTPASAGPLSGTLTITDPATGTHTVPLAGAGVAANSAVQLSQTSLNFGNQPVGTTSVFQTVYIINQGASYISVTDFQLTGDYQASGCGKGAFIYQNSSCAITIYFKPTVTGLSSGRITITDTGAGSPRIINLAGNGVNPFPIASVSTRSLTFSPQIQGTSSTAQSFTLTNSGTAALAISSIGLASTADFLLTPATNCPASLAVNGSCSINVTFRPSGAGALGTTLTITDNDQNNPGATQSVNLTGTGVAASPVLSISPTSLSFGNQAANSTSNPLAVTLTNQGNAALNVTSANAGAPFGVASNNCPASLNPNASCAIGVTFAPTSAGPQSGTLTINDNTAGSPHLVGLTGSGVGSPSITLTPASLIFSNQQVGVTSNQQFITVSNSGSLMTISSVVMAPGPGTNPGEFVLTNNCASTLATNASCSLGVTFTPVAVGTRTATVTVSDNSGSGQQTIPISGTGVGLPAVQLSASSLNFSDQNVGTTSAAQPVTLTNNGGGPLAISNMAASNGYSQNNNCGNSLDANGSCTINITFVPTIAGSQPGTITITDNATGSPHKITTSGVGLGAEAQFSPTSVNFGSVAVGTPANSPALTLTNVGNLPLNIIGRQINNPPYSETDNCQSPLQPSASCTFTVVFTPTAAATQNGSLHVTTNGINGGVASVSLTGVGFGPVATFNPTSLNFGSISVNTASPPQSVTLTSAGSASLTISQILTSGNYSQTNTCGTLPAPLPVSQTCTISVTFNPTAPGSQPGTLFVYDNTASSPHQLGLSGVGLGPAITFNPPSLNFGTLTPGTRSSPLSLTMTNSGTSTLLIPANGISITSAEYAQTNDCPSSLAAQASCTISVTFTPAGVGTRSGTLTVQPSNAPSASAPLTGVGAGPLVQLSATSLSFGSLPVGMASPSQPVVLTNTGNAALTISSIAASTTVGGANDFSQSNNCPISPGTLGPGSFCTMNVSFSPTVQGSESGAVTITDSAGGSPHIITLSGTGTGPQSDLAVTGNVSPATIAPGGSVVYTFVVTNGGPSPATGSFLNVSLPAPASATLNSVTTTQGTCAGTAPVVCSLGNLAVSGTATVTISMTAVASASLSTIGTAGSNETDPVNSNNTLTLTSVVLAADIAISSPGAPTMLGGYPAYTMVVTNNGPSTATNVTVACSYDRYQYIGSTTPYGSCSYSGATLTCALGTIAAGASTSITQQVQPPNAGWASVSCLGRANEFDPDPGNNLSQITPPADQFNTQAGSNITVHLTDAGSATAASVTFAKVTQPGNTSLTRTVGAAPPPAFRPGAQSASFDLGTSALYGGLINVSFGFAAAQFHKPGQVRLFHMEKGAWVDRTSSLDLSGGSVSAVTSSLSPFAIFEPVNHLPTANAGGDRTIAGSSVLGASVVLDGSLSSDADGDALTYRWTGPFPEGNGVISGAKPSVTLPFGASKITLVVNDGEADSGPVALNVTVSDFALTLSQGSAIVKRGQSTTLNVNVASKDGSYDQLVTLGCANLPAGFACQFSPPAVRPGISGATAILTLTSSSPLARNRQAPGPLWAVWTGLFSALGGVFVVSSKRGRSWTLIVLLLVLMAVFYTGCGGGGTSSVSSSQANNSSSSTITITVTGSSGGLQHSTTAIITVN